MHTLKFALGALLLLAPAAFCGIIKYDVILNGPSESPPNASPGTGFAVITVDNILNTLEVNVSFSGLLGNTTASHIHCCTTLPNAGTAGVATTTPTFTSFPLGVTSGNYDRVLDLTSASSYNPAFVTTTIPAAEATLLAGIALGDAYLNIHSTVNPGGEIRGFLVAETPEPGTMALVGFGLAAVAIIRRRARIN